MLCLFPVFQLFWRLLPGRGRLLCRGGLLLHLLHRGGLLLRLLCCGGLLLCLLCPGGLLRLLRCVGLLLHHGGLLLCLLHHGGLLSGSGGLLLRHGDLRTRLHCCGGPQFHLFCQFCPGSLLRQSCLSPKVLYSTWTWPSIPPPVPPPLHRPP